METTQFIIDFSQGIKLYNLIYIAGHLILHVIYGKDYLGSVL